MIKRMRKLVCVQLRIYVGVVTNNISFFELLSGEVGLMTSKSLLSFLR